MNLLFENWREFLDAEDYLLLEETLLDEGLKDWFKEKWEQLKTEKRVALKAAVQEWHETKGVAPILKKLISKEEVSEEEKTELNTQALDILKTVGWGTFAAVPGTLGGVALIIYILQKMGLTPLPSAYYDVKRITGPQ
jgi:hypothetical protein|tara:strand:+ start:202 stop:615 length:414 start_codon:yes stop_codon:yes gene_type:complete